MFQIQSIPVLHIPVAGSAGITAQQGGAASAGSDDLLMVPLDASGIPGAGHVRPRSGERDLSEMLFGGCDDGLIEEVPLLRKFWGRGPAAPVQSALHSVNYTKSVSPAGLEATPTPAVKPSQGSADPSETLASPRPSPHELTELPSGMLHWLGVSVPLSHERTEDGTLDVGARGSSGDRLSKPLNPGLATDGNGSGGDLIPSFPGAGVGSGSPKGYNTRSGAASLAEVDKSYPSREPSQQAQWTSAVYSSSFHGEDLLSRASFLGLSNLAGGPKHS